LIKKSFLCINNYAANPKKKVILKVSEKVPAFLTFYAAAIKIITGFKYKMK
jgi:hypothetical protein